jgi:hypothetical protein
MTMKILTTMQCQERSTTPREETYILMGMMAGDRWFSLEDLGSGDKARVGFGAVAGGSRG